MSVLIRKLFQNLYSNGHYTGPFNKFTGKPKGHNEWVSADHDIYYTAWECVLGFGAYLYNNKADEVALNSWTNGFYGILGIVFFNLKKDIALNYTLSKQEDEEIDRVCADIKEKWKENDYVLDLQEYIKEYRKHHGFLKDNVLTHEQKMEELANHVCSASDYFQYLDGGN